jgi:hypothetical protein
MAEFRRAGIRGVIVTLISAACLLAFAISRTPAVRAEPARAVTVIAPTPAEQAKLLEQHKPILYLQKGERWPPMRVDQFLRDARLEKQLKNDRWEPIQRKALPTTNEGCAFRPCLRLTLPCNLRSQGAGCFEKGAPPSDWRQAAVYGSFVTVGDPHSLKRRPAYLLRYSYFYYFDDWRSKPPWIWQVHEADWEGVTIGLSEDRRPLFAAYSQHCSGVWRDWKGKPDWTRGDRPIVHVALGSHAHYFYSTNQSVYLFRCEYSQDGWGEVARWVKGQGKGRLLFDQVDEPKPAPTPTTLVNLSLKRPRWADFPGVWSEGEYVYLAPRPFRGNRVRYGEGPKTPQFSSDKENDFWHETSN